MNEIPSIQSKMRSTKMQKIFVVYLGGIQMDISEAKNNKRNKTAFYVPLFTIKMFWYLHMILQKMLKTAQWPFPFLFKHYSTLKQTPHSFNKTKFNISITTLLLKLLSLTTNFIHLSNIVNSKLINIFKLRQQRSHCRKSSVFFNVNSGRRNSNFF